MEAISIVTQAAFERSEGIMVAVPDLGFGKQFHEHTS